MIAAMVVMGSPFGLGTPRIFLNSQQPLCQALHVPGSCHDRHRVSDSIYDRFLPSRFLGNGGGGKISKGVPETEIVKSADTQIGGAADLLETGRFWAQGDL